MGVGNVVLSGTIICADTVLKNHVCINTGSSIDHDNLLNNFSSTGPRVTTGGNVKIGELSSIGIGATVKQNIFKTCFSRLFSAPNSSNFNLIIDFEASIERFLFVKKILVRTK